MDGLFEVYLPGLHRTGQVMKSPFYLSILREAAFSVNVERLPLTEYFVFFDHPVKAEQIKVKIYKTLDNRWYDKNFSEEAELNSPEFGIPVINNEIKGAVDAFETRHAEVAQLM